MMADGLLLIRPSKSRTFGNENNECKSQSLPDAGSSSS